MTFKQKGALKRTTGDEFRDKILSRGYTADLMKAFTSFTGLQQPDAQALLKMRGL